jgi:5-methylcytosine-specific restriction endonuclease McrA
MPRRGRIDEQGRECSRCGIYKPWSDIVKNACNPSGYDPSCKACMSSRVRQWRKKNPGHYVRYNRGWRRRNPDKHAASLERRKQREIDAEGGPFSLSRPDYEPRWALYGGLCAYCLERPATTLDHAVPLSRGGTNYPENLDPACRQCNSSKHAKILHEEWTPPAKTKPDLDPLKAD